MIKMKFDSSSVDKNWRAFKAQITSEVGLGLAMKSAVDEVIVPKILKRLDTKPESNDGKWRQEINMTMFGTDEDFVNRLGGNISWAMRTEGDRRGYEPGKTDEIKKGIKSSAPLKAGDSMIVGIGDLNILNNVARIRGNHKLWQLLQWGTGIYGKSKSIIVRTKKQIFFDRRGGVGNFKGVKTSITKNPGFEGRAFFLELDGTMHDSDMVVGDSVKGWITSLINKFSGKK